MTELQGLGGEKSPKKETKNFFWKMLLHMTPKGRANRSTPQQRKEHEEPVQTVSSSATPGHQEGMTKLACKPMSSPGGQTTSLLQRANTCRRKRSAPREEQKPYTKLQQILRKVCKQFKPAHTLPIEPKGNAQMKPGTTTSRWNAGKWSAACPLADTTSCALTLPNGRSSRLSDERSVELVEMPVDGFLQLTMKRQSSSGYTRSARSNTSTIDLHSIDCGGLEDQCGHWAFGYNQEASLQGESRASKNEEKLAIEPGTPPKTAPILRRDKDITFDKKIAEAERQQLNAPIAVQEDAQDKGRQEAGKPAVMFEKKAAPPPAPDRKKGALPPPARELLKKRAAGGVQRQPKVTKMFRELHKALLNRQARAGNSNKFVIGAKTGGGDPGSLVNELATKSKYAQSIREDILNYDQVIRDLIKEIGQFKSSTMDCLVEFVNSTDATLNKLTDEPAVLKSFNWPRKYDVFREAKALHDEMKNLQRKFKEWRRVPNRSVGDELKLMEKFTVKCIERIDDVLKTEEIDVQRFKEAGVPWNTKIVQDVKVAALSLLEKYIRYSMEEVEKRQEWGGQHNQACLKLLTGTIDFSFQVHQFAGGLTEACSKLFDKASSKTWELFEA